MKKFIRTALELCKKYLSKLLAIKREIAIIAFITYVVFCLIFQIFVVNKGFNIESKLVSNYIRNYYYSYMPWIQFDPDCSEYDSELFYKMKPGKCTFRKAEFSVNYKNNSFGLRDEKEDFSNVSVITLGDSFTLGYGVKQNKTFASLIEKITGKKTLNAGISSYGTARESMMLNRILTKNKLPNLEYIILQYCSNDNIENDQYVKGDYKLLVGPNFSQNKKYDKLQVTGDLINPVGKIAYNDILSTLNSFGKVWSFKRVFYGNIIITLDQLGLIKNKQRTTPGGGYGITIDKIHENFLNIVQKKIVDNPLLPKNVKIILFNLESFDGYYPFYDALKAKLEQKQYSRLRNRIILIDMPKSLNKTTDFFKIDDHTNAHGNAKIARKLSEFIK